MTYWHRLMVNLQAHVLKFVSRVNTITGRAYRDEPAIFGWNLLNEPVRAIDRSIIIFGPPCYIGLKRVPELPSFTPPAPPLPHSAAPAAAGRSSSGRTRWPSS